MMLWEKHVPLLSLLSLIRWWLHLTSLLRRLQSRSRLRSESPPMVLLLLRRAKM